MIGKKKQKRIDNYKIKKFNHKNFNKHTLKSSLIAMNKRVFVAYIKFHFPLNGQKARKYQDKYKVLQSLEEAVLINAISRTKALEIIYETKYVIPFVGALIAVVVVPAIIAFGDSFIVDYPVYKKEIKLGAVVVASLCAVAVSVFITHSIKKDKNVLALLVSFRELLEQALAAKKNDEK
ncbi:MULTISPECIES: hypothetical protein [Bacillus]|uniref:hypothetical protein n=1 Tax=Bacillus TaxID=1386 RepID=UPI0006F386CA|nr:MULTISPECIES: hypothetical protein [Bacillus]KQU12169.1 hypothetical protein ASG46_06410 [Bacillus sp. Leaf49]MBS4747546.1 hypothetical protein [Bacillus altitudinis]